MFHRILYFLFFPLFERLLMSDLKASKDAIDALLPAEKKA